MSIELRAVTDPVGWMLEASANGVSVDAVRGWWESKGYSEDIPRAHDEHAFRLMKGSSDTGFVISVAGPCVAFLYVSVCYWPTFDAEGFPECDWAAERREFDATWESAHQSCVAALGEARWSWREPHPDAGDLRLAAWSLNDGLLIVQQAEYDAEFGVEVNLWWTPCVDEPAMSEVPFVDWLQSQRPNQGPLTPSA